LNGLLHQQRGQRVVSQLRNAESQAEEPSRVTEYRNTMAGGHALATQCFGRGKVRCRVAGETNSPGLHVKESMNNQPFPAMCRTVSPLVSLPVAVTCHRCHGAARAGDPT